MNEATAQVEKRIHAPAPKVWAALTKPASLKKFFFGADVETDWAIGGPIRMKGEFRGKKYEDKGSVIEVEPLRTLSFSHWSPTSGTKDAPENYHVVSFELEPYGNETQVTITQSNLIGGATASDIEHRAEYEKNWTGVLEGLAQLFP